MGMLQEGNAGVVTTIKYYLTFIVEYRMNKKWSSSTSGAQKNDGRINKCGSFLMQRGVGKPLTKLVDWE
jgi:hypothetical protein